MTRIEKPGGGRIVVHERRSAVENDYISREAVIKDLLSDTVITDDLFGMGALHERDRVIAKINDFPAADVRPVVRGEWRKSELYNDHPECPVCFYVSRERSNFCPSCGADMRGGQNGEANIHE